MGQTGAQSLAPWGGSLDLTASLSWVTFVRSRVVNPQLTDLENTDRIIDVEQWMLRTTIAGCFFVFFLLLPFAVLLCLSHTFSQYVAFFLQGIQASEIITNKNNTSEVWIG